MILETALSTAFDTLPAIPNGLILADFRDRHNNRLSYHLLGQRPYDRIEVSQISGKYESPEVTLTEDGYYMVRFPNKNPKLPNVTVKGTLKRTEIVTISKLHAKSLITDSAAIAFSNCTGREVVFILDNALLYYKGKTRLILPT